MEFDSRDSDGNIGIGIPIAGVQNVMLLIAQPINRL